MTTLSIADTLKYAQLQMAAEAFLVNSETGILLSRADLAK